MQLSIIQNRKLFIVLFILPISFIVFCSWLFFIPLPIFDYWAVLHRSFFLPDTSFSGWISFFWEPFVDQKMFFPKMFISSLAILTQNNHYGLEIAFGILGQIGVLGCICYLIKKNKSLNKDQQLILCLVSSFLLFWPNLLPRFQHHWYSTQYTFVLIFALSASASAYILWGSWLGVLLSILLATCSALSHGTGLIFLISFATVMTCMPEWSKAQKSSIVLTFLTLVLLIATQMPGREQLNLPPLNWFTEKPLQEFVFIFRCFGPDGVLRTQTGFLIMVLGLLSCGFLWRKKELFSKESFPWILLYFWGACVAVISAITRSSSTDSPTGIYFAFFVVVLNAVFVLAVVAFRKTALFGYSRRWKALVIVLLILYCAGTIDGIRDAASTQRRVLWSQERLHFFPLLNQHDYRWLYPTKGFEKIALDLHSIGILDDVNNHSFAKNLNINFTRKIMDDDVYFIPDKPLSANDVMTFSGELFSEIPFTCYWISNEKWLDEQSQNIQERALKNDYWVFFRNRETPGFNESVDAIKLRPHHQTDAGDLDSVPEPLVWSREMIKGQDITN